MQKNTFKKSQIAKPVAPKKKKRPAPFIIHDDYFFKAKKE
jgi:hypothetical protein